MVISNMNKLSINVLRSNFKHVISSKNYNKLKINNLNRLLCTKKDETINNNNTKESKDIKYIDYDSYDDYQEPKTAGEAVALYSQVLFNLFLLGVGITGVGVLVYFLWPVRYNSYQLFNETFEVVRQREEIIAITGEGSKAFGRDYGANTEGRRNHIDSRQFKEYNTNRTRIRFNIQGPKGKVMVWAEVTDKMQKGEFVFLICQDRKTGKVMTIYDNRDKLQDEYEALDSNSSRNSIFSKILGVSR